MHIMMESKKKAQVDHKLQPKLKLWLELGYVNTLVTLIQDHDWIGNILAIHPEFWAALT